MSRGAEADDDPLSRWLLGDGLEALERVVGAAPDVLAVIDRDLTIRYINWTGPSVTRESILGKIAVELTPPEYHRVAREAFARVLETGQRAHYETLYRAGDDVRMWDVRVGPIRDGGGRVIGVVAITTNVTEQRRAYADRDRFFSLSLDMLVVASPRGYFRRVNPAFGETLGYALAELVARPFLDFVHPDDRALTQRVFEATLGGTPVTDFENRYRHRNGQYRVFSWRATVDPTIGDVYAVARDVTDHRATELQLRQAQKMEAIGQLAGGVAHDFNNLLLAILANTELAFRSAPAPEVADRLREIDGAGQRAAELTKQLLAFSRQRPLRPVPVDLNRLLEGLATLLRRLLPESIEIELLPAEQLPSVSADPTQLEQVIVNLCVNARDAMERGGRLTMKTEDVVLDSRYSESHPLAKPGRYVLLSVTDTGVGMSREVQERAFEPFFTTKEAHEGSGLGLSTVYGIVRRHDGMVYFESEPGQGTTCRVYLPAGEQLASDVRDRLEASSSRGRETILLAEDDDRVRRAVVQVLERAGYRVIAAANGSEAVRLLGERVERVDLVLLDVVMPELGGPETWDRIRVLRSGLRVLFMSGYADDRYLKRLPIGAEVLEKPLPMEELLARVRRKLDE